VQATFAVGKVRTSGGANIEPHGVGARCVVGRPIAKGTRHLTDEQLIVLLLDAA